MNLIRNIPKEIHTEISSYLTTHEIIGSYRLVSQAFKENPVLLSQITLKANGSTASSLEGLDRLFRNVVSVKKVTYQASFLKALIIETNSKRIDESKINSFLQKLHFCSSFEKAELWAYLESCNSIENPESLKRIITKLLHNCKDLTIRSGNVYDQLVKREILIHEIFLAQSTNVQNLSLDTTVLSHDALDLIGNLQQLKSLKLSSVRLKGKIHQSPLLNRSAYSMLKKLQSLRIFVTNSTTINLKGIQALAKNKNLESLLIQIENCTDNDLSYFFEKENGEFPFPHLNHCYIQFDTNSRISPQTKERFKEERKDIKQLVLL